MPRVKERTPIKDEWKRIAERPRLGIVKAPIAVRKLKTVGTVSPQTFELHRGDNQVDWKKEEKLQATISGLNFVSVIMEVGNEIKDVQRRNTFLSNMHRYLKQIAASMAPERQQRDGWRAFRSRLEKEVCFLEVDEKDLAANAIVWAIIQRCDSTATLY